jgi:lipopolysaccharide transport system permease protein
MMTIIQPIRERLSPSAVLREYFAFGSLLKYLTLRDFRLRYRHAALGLVWVVLQPLLSMVIFAAVFSRVLRPSTGGVPYSLFALAGLVPWNFFSTSFSRASQTLVSSGGLMTKVYFPRGILPASAVLGSVLDLVVGCALVCGYAIFNHYTPNWRWLLLPAVVLQLVLATLFVSLGFATLTALQRDTKHAMQFVTQLWLYASPVIYPASLVPAQLRWLFGLNPLTGVLDAFRWCLLGTPPDVALYWTSLGSLVVMSACAVWIFCRYEQSLVERV